MTVASGPLVFRLWWFGRLTTPSETERRNFVYRRSKSCQLSLQEKTSTIPLATIEYSLVRDPAVRLGSPQAESLKKEVRLLFYRVIAFRLSRRISLGTIFLPWLKEKKDYSRVDPGEIEQISFGALDSFNKLSILVAGRHEIVLQASEVYSVIHLQRQSIFFLPELLQHQL